jgi:DUF971 family protein
MTSVTDLHYNRRTRTVTLTFETGQTGTLSAELLRVFSPSAEVRGHGGTPGSIPGGCAEVGIVAIEPVGHYALQFIFDDGHDSGLYRFDYLLDLANNQDQYWADYEAALRAQGLSRDPTIQVIQFQP